MSDKVGLLRSIQASIGDGDGDGESCEVLGFGFRGDDAMAFVSVGGGVKAVPVAELRNVSNWYGTMDAMSRISWENGHGSWGY